MNLSIVIPIYNSKAIIEKTIKTLIDVFQVVRTFCLKEKLAVTGDKVVVVAGAPFNTKGVMTNMLLIERI